MAHPAMAATPILREGDRLTVNEFLTRWEAMPDLKHAELINGVVFMASPVSFWHGDPQRDVTVWLAEYMEATPGCHSGLEVTWVMGPGNSPQPDGFLRILPEYGGQSGQTTAGYGEGAPELVVEISGSTTSRDLGAKLDLYCGARVREYITVLLKPQQVIWRVLSRGKYREAALDSDGLFHSRTFPGLWLDPQALSSPKQTRIRTALGSGLQTPEHAAFVKKLASALHRK